MSPQPTQSPTSDPSTPGIPGSILGFLLAGVAAGVVVGLLFGTLDGVVAGRRTSLSGAGPWFTCVVRSVAISAGIFAVVGGLAGLLAWPLRSTFLGRLGAGFPFGLAFALGAFLEIYWWSRAPLGTLTFGFADYGLPALHWKRMVVTAAFALLSLGLGALAGWVVARSSILLRRTVFAVSFAIALLGAYLLLGGPGEDPRGVVHDGNRDLPNVIVFVVDALREDKCGPYGGTRIPTPVMDSVAARGVTFENAFVEAPFTWSSFGSILTGKYPRRHGLVKMAPGVRMADNQTLALHLDVAERLDGSGPLTRDDYVGAAFMTGTLSHGSGLLRGFDHYYEAMVGHSLTDGDDPWSVFRSELLVSIFRNKMIQRVEEAPVSRVAVDWFRGNADRRFVSMVHYYSTHTPWDPPARFREPYCDPDYRGPFENGFYSYHREGMEAENYEPSEEELAFIRGLYDGGVAQADWMIGQVLEELERQGVLENTIVVVTSDHGEELYDHGLWEHNWMYETNLRIPLIMMGPGIPKDTRVPALVETIDLVPTICELIGVEPPHHPEEPEGRGLIDGVSLVPLMRGEVDSVKDHVFAENGLYTSVSDGKWKLIVDPGLLEEGAFEFLAEGWPGTRGGDFLPSRLFDLEHDRGEYANLFEPDHPEARRLIAVLRDFDQRMPTPHSEIVKSARDINSTSNLLNSLGYTEEGVGHGVKDSKNPRDGSGD